MADRNNRNRSNDDDELFGGMGPEKAGEKGGKSRGKENSSND
jgi:hypothetical protein